MGNGAQVGPAEESESLPWDLSFQIVSLFSFVR